MSPCNWPVSYAGCSSCAPLMAMGVEEREAFEEMAADYLWNWTRRQFGVCRLVLRPAGENCGPTATFEGSGPYAAPGMRGRASVLLDGEWTGFSCGRCASACECSAPVSLKLPGPVVSVYEVKIDGAVLAPGAYRTDGDLLVRLDGEAWPLRQNLDAVLNSVGTWSVTYDRGTPVPLGGQLSAGLLACELAKAACRDPACALPQRIQTITRQGVTMAMIDTFDDVEKGFTGIWLIDSWISSVINPPRASTVHSVDLPRSRSGRVSRG